MILQKNSNSAYKNEFPSGLDIYPIFNISSLHEYHESIDDNPISMSKIIFLGGIYGGI
jgi:hypothetical protein